MTGSGFRAEPNPIPIRPRREGHPLSDEPNGNSPQHEGQESDYRLRAVINAMPVPASWARIGDRRIIFVNRKFTQLFGYQLGDFETVDDWIERAYPEPEHQRKILEKWGPYFEELPEGQQYMDPLEVDVLCRDGTIKTTLIGGVILPASHLIVATWVDISERKRDEVQIQQLAEQDSLTGLRNRRSFDAFLERSLVEAGRRGDPVYLLILDLDRFKEINDSHGHQVGDSLLQEVARRIRAAVRSSDLVARFGGDEFGLVLIDTPDDAAAGRVCEKLVGRLSEPYEIAGETLSIGASVGVSRFPGDGQEPQNLFRLADQALYRAKQEGRGTWRLADASRKEGSQEG